LHDHAFQEQSTSRKFAELLVQGEISPETYEEWNRSTGSKALPERVHQASKHKRKTSRKTSVRPKVKSVKAKRGARKR
jgi:macrodomain Ter protein organizer (MatP/YcbG family)